MLRDQFLIRPRSVIKKMQACQVDQKNTGSEPARVQTDIYEVTGVNTIRFSSILTAFNLNF